MPLRLHRLRQPAVLLRLRHPPGRLGQLRDLHVVHDDGGRGGDVRDGAEVEDGVRRAVPDLGLRDAGAKVARDARGVAGRLPVPPR